MYDVVKDLLAYIETTDVANDQDWGAFSYPAAARSFMVRVYQKDIWDPDFRRKMTGIRNKEIKTLDIHALYVWFTAIVATERVSCGFFREMTLDGTVKALLDRYIEIYDQKLTEWVQFGRMKLNTVFIRYITL